MYRQVIIKEMKLKFENQTKNCQRRKLLLVRNNNNNNNNNKEEEEKPTHIHTCNKDKTASYMYECMYVYVSNKACDHQSTTTFTPSLFLA